MKSEKLCVNCKNWDHNNQFVSSYDGKERALCSIIKNSSSGWETCDNHEGLK
jgi:hypothetical protein